MMSETLELPGLGLRVSGLVVRSKRLIQSPSFLAVLLSFFVAGCLQNIFNVSLTW